MSSFRELKVWQARIELATDAYRWTINFPKDEKFGLTSQIRRAATSIPANMAEGHARDSTKDYLRFVSFAMGSLAELETHLIVANRLELIRSIDDPLTRIHELGRRLRSLQLALKRKIDSP